MTVLPSSTDHVLAGDAAAQANHALRSHAAITTREAWGERKSEPLTVLRRADADMIGCACGLLSGGWLCIELLWVEPPYRDRDIGTELLAALEKEALARGAHSAYLWTQEYEAPDFYRKQGYRAFTQLLEFGPGHQLIGMQKPLVAAK